MYARGRAGIDSLCTTADEELCLRVLIIVKKKKNEFMKRSLNTELKLQ